MASCATLWFNNGMWNDYFIPTTIDEALHILAEGNGKARLAAGATDLMLELERGVRKGVASIIDITRLPDLDQILMDENGIIHIGPLVTHNQVAASRMLREQAFPLVSACWQVGAPQIRNRATVAGNLITASPANDTITPLMALGAWVRLASVRGTRQVPLEEFYTGVRKTVMQPDEMLVEIAFPALNPSRDNGDGKRGTFLKLGLRRAQAISLVNAAVILDKQPGGIRRAAITLGAVAPTIIHATEAEASLQGKELTEEVIARAAELASNAARPIDDIRGSAAYRKEMVRVLVQRGLRSLRDRQEQAQVPETPVLLSSVRNKPAGASPARPGGEGPVSRIHTTINGKEYTFDNGHARSLLSLLRDEAGLTGTKEGCAEGECGACTIYLDGKAVMACLVPAPRADGAEIITIEGLADNDELNPVQASFVADGAVQCGYCTPGFIMSAAKLLEEHPQPGRDMIMQAITGNLCRCTGYYKIVQAIEDASKVSDKATLSAR
jgi:xanthine dehydrogenase iron-sulfur cluster and FAD-binding subunit A